MKTGLDMNQLSGKSGQGLQEGPSRIRGSISSRRQEIRVFFGQSRWDLQPTQHIPPPFNQWGDSFPQIKRQEHEAKQLPPCGIEE